jgi:hypothetical protein
MRGAALVRPWKPQVALCGPCRLLAEVFWVAAGDVYAPEFAFSPQAYDGFPSQPSAGAHLAGAQPSAQPVWRLWFVSLRVWP